MPSLNPLQNRVARLLRRFHPSRATAETRQRWQALKEQGEALGRLMASPDWPFLEARREVFMRLRDMVLREVTSSDDARREAAMERHTLEQFFREVRQAVREGQKASEALKPDS